MRCTASPCRHRYRPATSPGAAASSPTSTTWRGSESREVAPARTSSSPAASRRTRSTPVAAGSASAAAMVLLPGSAGGHTRVVRLSATAAGGGSPASSVGVGCTVASAATVTSRHHGQARSSCGALARPAVRRRLPPARAGAGARSSRDLRPAGWAPTGPGRAARPPACTTSSTIRSQPVLARPRPRPPAAGPPATPASTGPPRWPARARALASRPAATPPSAGAGSTTYSMPARRGPRRPRAWVAEASPRHGPGERGVLVGQGEHLVLADGHPVLAAYPVGEPSSTEPRTTSTPCSAPSSELCAM